MEIAAFDSQFYHPFFPSLLHVTMDFFYHTHTVLGTIFSRMQDEVFSLNLVLKFAYEVRDHTLRSQIKACLTKFSHVNKQGNRAWRKLIDTFFFWYSHILKKHDVLEVHCQANKHLPQWTL
jgi:hypothetical protein